MANLKILKPGARAKDGSILTSLLSGTMIDEKHLMVVAIDITAQKKAEVEIKMRLM